MTSVWPGGILGPNGDKKGEQKRKERKRMHSRKKGEARMAEMVSDGEIEREREREKVGWSHLGEVDVLEVVPDFLCLAGESVWGDERRGAVL